VKTLICVAGMPYAVPTVKLGGLVAGLRNPDVTLLTVIKASGDEKAAYEMLAQAQMHMNLSVGALKVRKGSPVEEIVQESREGEYDLVVVGDHVVKGIFDIFLQSITSQVTRHALGSVLIVKGNRPQLQRILLATGGRQVSRNVVRSGAQLARDADAEVILLHVADPVPGMYTGLETMDESLQELLTSNTPIARHLRWAAQLLASYEIKAEVALNRGMAVNEILRKAKVSNSDLIVIGAQVENSTWLNDLLMSTVTPQVVDHAPCSILVVRSKD